MGSHLCLPRLGQMRLTSTTLITLKRTWLIATSQLDTISKHSRDSNSTTMCNCSSSKILDKIMKILFRNATKKIVVRYLAKSLRWMTWTLPSSSCSPMPPSGSMRGMSPFISIIPSFSPMKLKETSSFPKSIMIENLTTKIFQDSKRVRFWRRC